MIHRLYFKRVFDVITAICSLAIFFIPFIFIVFIYLLANERPIFFIQKRTGFKGRAFDVFKFRTLTTGEKPDLNSRRFLLGDILRFFSIDELPQLWNVLKGDMSVIGPRPLPVDYLTLYSNEQLTRHNVRPGITGWAQVKGRHAISWEKKFELDIYYVTHISFGLDMVILFKTIVLLLSFKKDNSLKEEKFRGS